MLPKDPTGKYRKRLERDRFRRGVEMLAHVEVSGGLIEVLIERSLLEAWDAKDQKKVDEALQAAVDEWRDRPLGR